MLMTAPDEHQTDFFKDAVAALPVAASSPLAAVLLAAIVVAAVVLYLKQAQYKSQLSKLSLLPEADRLRLLMEELGVRPKKGVSATAWLSSRRQSFLFGGYLSTLAMALLAFAIVYNHVVKIPGGRNRAQLLKELAQFQDELEGYVLVVRNARDSFSSSAESVIDPDPETDALLTRRVTEYNAVYRDLRDHRASYTQAVTQWLADSPDLVREVQDVMEYALKDVHEGGVLALNEAVTQGKYELQEMLDGAGNVNKEVAVQHIKATTAKEIHTICDKIDREVPVLEEKRQQLSKHVSD
jgi:hypothetical protein